MWDDHEVQNDYTSDPFWFSHRNNPPCGFGEAERCPEAFKLQYTMTDPAQESGRLRGSELADRGRRVCDRVGHLERDAEVYGPYYGPMIKFNPHSRFFDGDRHGSMKARVKRSEIEVDWRIADRVGDPNAPVRTLRTFAVESGRPGIAQA